MKIPISITLLDKYNRYSFSTKIHSLLSMECFFVFFSLLEKINSCHSDSDSDFDDSDDELALEMYRNMRMAEMKALSLRPKFGGVREISGQDYVEEVNKAGQGIYVVLHLYAKGIPLCSLINQFLNELAPRFPETKFIKAIASTCLPNFPEKNLPSIFIYYEGEMKQQFIGPVELRGEKLSREEFEYMLGLHGAIETDIKEDPREKVKDKMFSDLAETNDW